MSHSQDPTRAVIDLATPPRQYTALPYASTLVRPGSQGAAAQTSETRRQGTSTLVTLANPQLLEMRSTLLRSLIPFQPISTKYAR
jgi:hypothetical protein